MQDIMHKRIITTQIDILSKFKMAAAAILNFTTMLPFHYY
jgi:hypothetical protein